MDRSCPADPNLGELRLKGRPIGLLALWLKKPGSNMGEHVENKKSYATPAHYADRVAARTELWELRHVFPVITELFEIEAKLPDDMLGDTPGALWEPLLAV